MSAQTQLNNMANNHVLSRRAHYDWHTFAVIFWREFVRMKSEPSRLLGIVVQPLMFWFVIGSGFMPNFRMEQSGSLDYLSFFYPGILVMVVLFGAIFSTITVIEDRQQGFLQGVLVGPGSRAALVMGKILGISAISLLQALLFFALAPLIGVNLTQANWFMTFLVLFLGALSLSSLGFFFAWLSESSAAYHALMSIILIPLWILSGGMFPTNNGWIAKIALINPMAWLTSALRAALNGGIAPLGTVHELLSFNTAFLLLFVFAVALSFAAIFVCNWRR